MAAGSRLEIVSPKFVFIACAIRFTVDERFFFLKFYHYVFGYGHPFESNLLHVFYEIACYYYYYYWTFHGSQYHLRSRVDKRKQFKAKAKVDIVYVYVIAVKTQNSHNELESQQKQIEFSFNSLRSNFYRWNFGKSISED